MDPKTRPDGFTVVTVDARRDLSLEETQPQDAEQMAREPVEIIAGLDMSDQLRTMFGTQETATILPHVYVDLRERLDHLTSQVTSLMESQKQVSEASRDSKEAREAALQAKSSVQDLREMVEAHTLETDREAAAAESEIRVLRGRIESVAVVIPDPKSSEEKIMTLKSRIHDAEKDLSRALNEVRDLNQLTSSLSRENTILRDRVRALDTAMSAGQESRNPHTLNPRQGDIRVDPINPRSPVVESASQAAPSRPDNYALPAPPRIQEHAQSTRMTPPTFEEFMTGVRVPLSERAPPLSRIRNTPGIVTAPLNTVANSPGPITMCDVPTQAGPLYHVANILQDREGPYCPGLLPLVPMLTAFKTVVSYRYYRLRDTRAMLSNREGDALYRVKRCLDSLYPTLQIFDGTKPISLLEFLSTLREGFDALRVSEAVAALALVYYLDGSAKTHYTSQVSPGVRSSSNMMASTWPYLVDSMIKRYLTDDVLQSAHEKVTDAKQEPKEDENAFADRIISAARDCCNVFEDRELVKHYIRRLLPSTRDAVKERIRQLPTNEQGEIKSARRTAQAEGNTYRARLAVTNPSSPRPNTTPRKVMLVHEEDYTPTPPRYEGPQSFWTQLRHDDPEQALNIARNLESLLFVGNAKGRQDMMPESPSTMVSVEDLLRRGSQDVPELTEVQYRDAITVIPPSYWSLNCWTCKTDGHTTFTCPYLTAAQILYFATVISCTSARATPP